MRRWIPRWYWWVPWGLGFLGLLLIPLGGAFDQWLQSAIPPIVLWLLNIFFAIPSATGCVPAFLLAAIWLCWVCPCLSAGERNSRSGAEPRRRLRRLRRLIWLPAVAATAEIVVFGVAVPLVNWYQNFQLVPYPWVFLGIAMGWLVVTAPPAWLIDYSVRTRLRRATSASRICFDCGYDLRGNLSGRTCPECGAPIPITPVRGT